MKVVTGLLTHSTTAADGVAPDYLSMMRYNVTTFVGRAQTGVVMTLTGLLRRPKPHQHTAPVVSLDHVTVRYNGGAPALEDVAGGTSTENASPWSGRTVQGRARCSSSSPACKPTSDAESYGYGAGGHICIGYVPQRSNVDWAFPVTVADVVMMGRVAKVGLLRQAERADRELVRQSLEQVGADFV